MKKVVFLLLLPAVLLMVIDAGAEERQYKRWKLDFERGTFDFVYVKDATGNSKICWYLVYKVTNNTEMEVPLRLSLKAKTDTKKTYVDTFAPMAQVVLQRKTGKKYKNSVEMFTGDLAPGDSAEGVAFFGDIDPNYDKLSIEVVGLYDVVDQVEGELFYEKKVLVLKYDRPGDEFGAAGDEVTYKGDEWIIEGERTKIPQRPIR